MQIENCSIDRIAAPPPSRHANPFATCWTRPGAIAFQFPVGKSAERLVAQLAAAAWWGEIVGPHGSGKSTLLETLKPQIIAAGRNVAAITLRDGQRRLPKKWLQASLATSRPLVIIDGYEQLSLLSRVLLQLRCRRASAGLLVTSHARTKLPNLFRTESNMTVAAQLVSTLTARIPSPITACDVAASHACHGSNLREMFFALYDRHEALARSARTAAISPRNERCCDEQRASNRASTGARICRVGKPARAVTVLRAPCVAVLQHLAQACCISSTCTPCRAEVAYNSAIRSTQLSIP